MSIARQLQPIINAFRDRQPMRAKSLIITLFGDVISQHGGEIWLGSIAESVEALGVNDRLVRTSVFRLVKEGWLEVEREGRKSFYGFTRSGGKEYQRAAQRIYSAGGDSWRGGWQLLIPTHLPEHLRDDFRRSLTWLGFRPISNGTFARPGGDEESIRDLLDEFDLNSGVVVMAAKTTALTTAKEWRAIVSEHWQLNHLEEDYRQLIGLFRPLKKALDKGKLATPVEAFQARLLLIHEYRRILLRDTPLPNDLLPNRWQGTVARQLAQALYRDLAAPSTHYIQTDLVNRQGRLPESEHYFYERFGGIAKVS
ncbi:phenylacetic acid degradation operon negative regulatory protein PaaX [Luminiphilus sp. nBUS_16]|uniref:phenylacetic acid degradation operon negative regulatory protein PaaX n=1 Tax=Luminiphilus sp. nBUS_16 TaxID=3395315 RepID=UPI003EC13889